MLKTVSENPLIQLEVSDIILSKFPGAIDYEEGLVLEAFVRLLGCTTIVETGCGYSTYFLANGLGVVGTQGKVIIFEQDEEKSKAVRQLLKNRCLRNYCEFISGDSLQNLKSLRTDHPFVDLAFIDSEHEYTHVLQELKSVYENLKPGGLIIGHDAQHDPGAARAYQTFVSLHNLLSIQIQSSRGLILIQ